MAAAGAEHGGLNYRELYKDLNQISDSLRLDQMEFSEVMVIHRMYIKLEELDLGHLEGADKVKRLYVLADVVDMEDGGQFPDVGPSVLRLPGSMMVVILCRVLYLRVLVLSMSRNNARRVQLPHMNFHVVQEVPARTVKMHRVELQTEAAPSDQLAVCIHARIIQCYIRPSDPAFPYFLEFLRLGYPVNEATGVVFSYRPASSDLVRPQVRSFYVASNLGQVRQTPGPDQIVSINPASLATDGYHVFVVSFFHDIRLSSSNARAEELEPAFSLLKPNIPVVVLTDPNVLLLLQTSLLIAELVELAHPSADTTAAVAQHLQWLNTLLLQATSEVEEGTAAHDEYLGLLFRAQYLVKMMGRARSLVVPQLQYDVYSNLINRMAQVAESYDQALRQFKLFILQNKILGSYLLAQNRAFAEREKDMEVFHSELLSQRKLELETAIQKMDQLSSQMETQSADMEQARQDMEEGLRRFQNRAVASAMFSVFGAIAAVSLTFLTGGATAPVAVAAARGAVTAAGALARGLQRVVEILDGLQAAMELVYLIKELMSSLKEIGQLVEAPEMPELPSEADWEIFVNEVEGVAEEMPTEVSEVSAWKTKCKNVAVLGREMNTTAAYISQLQYDIKVQDMLQGIARNHADRLLSIEAADMSSYTAMVTEMDMRTTRMLVALIKVVHIQNAALMYECLSLPTHVNAWPVTMETVWSMLVQHEHAAILGLMRLGPSFDFMRTYVVKDIPVSLLLDGEDWELEIPVDDYTFPSTWSRVRIHHLEMKFVQGKDNTAIHQPITDTGSVYLLLQGSRLFRDRNQSDVLHYEAAMSLDYHYAYRLDTGETTLSNLPSQDFTRSFMRMTPFTTWRLRLSASAEENQGLAFPTATSADSTTQIAITFYISAIRRISL